MTRSLLISSISPKILINACFYNADAVIFDLDDNIPDKEKDEDRELLVQAIKNIEYNLDGTIVKINKLSSNIWKKDLEAVLPLGIKKISFNLNSKEEVKIINDFLISMEEKYNLEKKSVELYLFVGNPLLIMDIQNIVLEERIKGIIFDSYEFRKIIKVDNSKNSEDLSLAKKLLVMACASKNILCIDNYWNDLSDEEGFIKDIQNNMNIGFNGKVCIHPNQIGIVNNIYSTNKYYRESKEIKTLPAPIENKSPNNSKIVSSIRESIIASGLKDGMTISYQTNHRNNNNILNLIIEEIDKLGIKDLTLDIASLGKIHIPLMEYIKKGVITKIITSGIRGEIGKEISFNNILKKPVIFKSVLNKMNSVISGSLKIDVTFIIASAADPLGNLNGINGVSAFGSMGYSITNVKYANKVVAISDSIFKFPLKNISISMEDVDFVVKIDALNKTIPLTNSIRLTKNPRELMLAEKASDVLINLGYIKNGYSIHPGNGGSFLAICKYLKKYMTENDIKGSFICGGISSYLVSLLEKEYFDTLYDLQSYDLISAASLLNNKNHIEVSTHMYSELLNILDISLINATEIDVNFNVNLLTGSNGIIMGVPTIAQDIAKKSKITLAISSTTRKRIPIIVDEVTNVVVPGNDVDIFVSEYGICVNPQRKDLIEILENKKIPTIDIKTLRDKVLNLTGKPKKTEYTESIIGIIESNDGNILDEIKQIKF